MAILFITREKKCGNKTRAIKIQNNKPTGNFKSKLYIGSKALLR
jgi:hypothetical protein